MTKNKPRVPTTPSDRPHVWHGTIPGSHEPGFTEQPLRQLANLPREFETSIWQMGECAIIRSHDPAGPHGELRWHLSISCEKRHPSWDEIKTARYRLLPHNLTFALLLPPPAEYVNVPEQDHVFHLWEIAEPD